MKLLVCHSPNASSCGIAVYGQQLDQAFASAGVDVLPFTFQQPDDVVAAATPGAALLVHFEPSFLSGLGYDFVGMLRQVRARGTRVVFCCHWYAPEWAAQWSAHADALVAHRSYGSDLPRTTVIPLGCPSYAPPAGRRTLRQKYDLPRDAVVVTTLGFLAPWKRFPAVVDALLRRLPEGAFLQMLTPAPFNGDQQGQIPEMRRVFSRHAARPHFFSTTFRPDEELLDRAHLSDLGFLFHGQDTGSVSAATKTFTSARVPCVVTQSSHASDLRGGVVRVPGYDPEQFAEVVADLAANARRRLPLVLEAEREYARLNMAATARRYVDLFEALR